MQAGLTSTNECPTFQTHKQATASGKLSTLRTYFGCLAAAVAYLHDKCVRHKDIKPKNILVDKGIVILTDFGLSKDFADEVGSTTSGPTAASPRYSPPEVAAYHDRNTSADIWSLGCVFFEIAAAIQGYDIEWIKGYCKARHSESTHFYENPAAYHELIEEWKVTWPAKEREPLAWIEKMLNKDRTGRPTAAEIHELITSPGASETGPMTFCGICCIPGDCSDSIDSLDDDVKESAQTTIDNARHVSQNNSNMTPSNQGARADGPARTIHADGNHGLIDPKRAIVSGTDSGTCTPDTTIAPDDLQKLFSLANLRLSESPEDSSRESAALMQVDHNSPIAAASGTKNPVELSHISPKGIVDLPSGSRFTCKSI